MILQAAAASQNDYSFRTTVPDGTDFYYAGKVMDFTSEFGGINMLMMSSKIELNSEIVETV